MSALPPDPGTPVPLIPPEVLVKPKPFLTYVRDRFLAGLFAVLPLVLTYWIISFVYNFVNGPADRLIRQLIHDHLLPGSAYFAEHQGGTIPGAGFMLTLFIILLIGMVTGHFLGRRLLQGIDEVLSHVPVVKVIYQALRQAVQALQQIGGEKGSSQFRQVAYIRLPGSAARIFGFVTGKFVDEQGATLVTVFVPHAPSPLTGLIFVVPEGELELAHGLTVEQATKLVISLGLIAPGAKKP